MGFELTTFGFGDQRSNRLSYRDFWKFADYISLLKLEKYYILRKTKWKCQFL